MTGQLRLVLVVGATLTAASAARADFESVIPVPGDATVGVVLADEPGTLLRRTGSGGFQPPPEIENEPDLLQISYGQWRPFDAPAASFDPFEGEYRADGDHLRVDLVLACFINPPGPTTDVYDPLRYGASPCFGFVEFDADANVDSGGSIAAPEFRYNAQVGRFGGRPHGAEFDNRIRTDGLALDRNFFTPPWGDRSGQDFTLAIFGEMDDILEIIDVTDPGNPVSPPAGPFAPGMTWDVHGRFFRRAGGYAGFVLGGAYRPIVCLRYQHHPTEDVTTITLVYPLTQAGWARGNGGDPESPPPIDTDTLDGTSIEEALTILEISAPLGINDFDPYWNLLQPWETQQASDYLAPQDWRSTVIVGSAIAEYIVGEGMMNWSDIRPNVVPGDVSGDGVFDTVDVQIVQDFIAQADGDPSFDEGPGGDGVVTLPNHATFWSIHDLDYDGTVDAADVGFAGCHVNGAFDGCLHAIDDCNANGVRDACELDHDCNGNGIPDECEGSGDGTFDCLIDLGDFMLLAGCLGGPDDPYPNGLDCIFFDVDHDLDVDLHDFAAFQALMGSVPEHCAQPPGACDGSATAHLLIESDVEGVAARVLPNPMFANSFVLQAGGMGLDYPPGSVVTIEVLEPTPPGVKFEGWSIDGRLVRERAVTTRVKEITKARAVFSGRARPSDVACAEPLGARHPSQRRTVRSPGPDAGGRSSALNAAARDFPSRAHPVPSRSPALTGLPESAEPGTMHGFCRESGCSRKSDRHLARPAGTSASAAREDDASLRSNACASRVARSFGASAAGCT